MLFTTRYRTGLVTGALALLLVACGDQSPRGQQASNQPASIPPAAEPLPAPLPPPSPPPPSPAEQLSQALAGLDAQSSDRGQVVSLPSASFAAGQTNFQPADESRVERIVALLRDHPDAQVLIEGYSDSRGNESANMRISRERADAVRHALISRGIDESRLHAKGLGEARPVADNSTPEGRQQNRRVELVFSDIAGKFASAETPAPSG